VNPDLARCAQEETSIGEQIRAGDREFGLKLGAQDWLKEEAFTRGEPNGGIEDRHAR
jgi:hypothetical protein